jgi:hypothetical protein
VAGIAFLSGSGQRRAIITMWAANSPVRPVSGVDYSQVPAYAFPADQKSGHTYRAATPIPQTIRPQPTCI